MTMAALFDELGEPLEDAPVPVHLDTGCDWARLDPRFGSCLTCPLVYCRLDYSPGEQQRVDKLVQRALRGEPAPARPSGRDRRLTPTLHRVITEAVATR